MSDGHANNLSFIELHLTSRYYSCSGRLKLFSGKTLQSSWAEQSREKQIKTKQRNQKCLRFSSTVKESWAQHSRRESSSRKASEKTPEAHIAAKSAHRVLAPEWPLGAPATSCLLPLPARSRPPPASQTPARTAFPEVPYGQFPLRLSAAASRSAPADTAG